MQRADGGRRERDGDGDGERERERESRGDEASTRTGVLLSVEKEGLMQ